MTGPSTRLPHARDGRLPFSWNGRRLLGREGDSVAAALHGAGVLVIGHSRKYREPRGLSGSFAAGHLARIEDIPHCRLERVPLVEGLRVRSQGGWPGTRLDVLRLVRWLPRRTLWAGFEHPRLIPDRSFLWRPWERWLATAAGVADAPSRDTAVVLPAGRRLRAGTVVVGAGPTGVEAAVEAGAGTLLVTRGSPAARLPDTVAVLARHEVFALYQGGRLVAAAPFAADEPAVLIDAERVVLATGCRSIPPLVPGAALPGVLDARLALSLARDYAVAPGQAVVVIGSDGRETLAGELRALGIRVVACLPAASLTAIRGRARVWGIEAGAKRIACDALVHAGPWRPDASLPFQAAAGGSLRLAAGEPPAHVRVVGSAAQAPEPVAVPERLDARAYVCPCMDVSVGEVLHQIGAGACDIEELKRLTGCGMGPCQGLPCWELLAAVIARATGRAPETIELPTLRPPRAALTFAQAAGLGEVTVVPR